MVKSAANLRTNTRIEACACTTAVQTKEIAVSTISATHYRSILVWPTTINKTIKAFFAKLKRW
jgi:hypothetical protein